MPIHQGTPHQLLVLVPRRGWPKPPCRLLRQITRSRLVAGREFRGHWKSKEATLQVGAPRLWSGLCRGGQRATRSQTNPNHERRHGSLVHGAENNSPSPPNSQRVAQSPVQSELAPDLIRQFFGGYSRELLPQPRRGRRESAQGGDFGLLHGKTTTR